MRRDFDAIPARGLRILAAACSSLTLWACATIAGPAATAVAPVPEGQRWSLVGLADRATPPATPLARVPYVVLNDGRLAGSAGCNRVMSEYRLDGPALRFGHAAGTRMMCSEGMELEDAFLRVFDQVAAWRADGDGIQWLDAGGKVLASFSAAIRAYRCDDGNEVLVRPGSADGQGGIVLSLKGREYAMRPAPVASGTRYVVEQGRREDWSMEWRGKGSEAMLLEAPLSHDRTAADLKIFARCRAS